jgi:4-carboxymuconolactone decarboxylase
MKALNMKEQELVAIGAAIASNCIPCIKYHIPQAKAAGLTDAQILAAVDLAEKVRSVPAKKVLLSALSTVERARTEPAEGSEPCGARAEQDVLSASDGDCGCQ